MRIFVTMITSWLLCSATVFGAEPTAIHWHRMEGLSETSFVTIVRNFSTPVQFVATGSHAVYLSADGGQNWHEGFRLPAQTTIESVALNSATPATILLATNRGVFTSLDAGQTWSHTFSASGETKTDCTFITFQPNADNIAWLGTRNGLFTSNDQGQHWREVQVPAQARQIIQLTFHPQNPDRLYLLSDHGLYAGAPAEGNWVRRPEMLSHRNDAEQEISDLSGPTETAQPRNRLGAIAIDPQHPSTLYLGTSQGVLTSIDEAIHWQPLPRIGLPSSKVLQLAVQADPAGNTLLVAATANGLATYDPITNRWFMLQEGLSPQVRQFCVVGNTLWVATKAGLFRVDWDANSTDSSAPPSVGELLDTFVHEPTITQVRDAAIRYAEVHPDKIRLWRKQAALRAVLPKVNVGFDHTGSRNTHIDEGSFPHFQLIDTHNGDSGFDVSLNWDLGGLIWNDDQTAIDTRSKLMVELRDDLVNEVTRVYFERRRLQLALLTAPALDQRTLLEKELRIQELTALLDGLSGGFFSNHTAPHIN